MTRTALLKRWDAIGQQLLIEQAVATETLRLAFEAREMLEAASDEEIADTDPEVLLAAIRVEAASRG